MTAAEIGDPTAPADPIRRFFSDAEKLAIARETEQPSAKVSAVARKHGIVTGLLFRRHVQFGTEQKKRAKLADIVLAPTRQHSGDAGSAQPRTSARANGGR
ncbi:transposase [Bradyrhizobium diazoefficiens]|uniref:transposase n=1 Tax=Bradyrhizobium diazoefficiens TaxID=1355477 RepID=UPI003D9B4A95